jgi:homoserine kinase
MTNSKLAEVTVPASTSNLGAGFDCFGLALQLYLNVRASIGHSQDTECVIEVATGKENAGLLLSADNLIYRAMVHAAAREAASLPPVRLRIDNQIPIARGLGGSAAAVIAGLKLFSQLIERGLTEEKILKYAVELEGHPDNAAPSLLGGFVVNCMNDAHEVISLKRSWPNEVKLLAIVPEMPLNTKLARSVLPKKLDHHDAVFNLQRTALFVTALESRRYDLLWEAMQDRLHQQQRSFLLPGLDAALTVPKMPGLLGVALSGAGPTVVALFENNGEEIGLAIAKRFDEHGTKVRVLELGVDAEGCRVALPR